MRAGGPTRGIWVSVGGEGSGHNKKPKAPSRGGEKGRNLQSEGEAGLTTSTVDLTSHLKSIVCKVREEGR